MENNSSATPSSETWLTSARVKQQRADDGARQKISYYGTLPQALGHGAHHESTAQQQYQFHNYKPDVHKPETLYDKLIQMIFQREKPMTDHP